MKSISKYNKGAPTNNFLLVISILGACLYFTAPDLINAQTHKNVLTLGQEAVFYPGKDFLKTFHSKCDSLQFPKFGECFVSVMQSSGASSQAVDFAYLVDNTGYMRYFRDTGKVDVAYVTYPFRANENQGFFLVNGNPPFIDVDDLLALPQEDLKKDARYRKIVGKYPQANLWPGDRMRTFFPENTSLPGGGQRFTVIYWLQDGCHACERLGLILYAFDFDSSGKFLGRKFLKAVSIKTGK